MTLHKKFQIELVSKSREFSDIQLRMNEKRPLNTLNRDKNRVTIRLGIFIGLKIADTVSLLQLADSFGTMSIYHLMGVKIILEQVATSSCK